MDGTNLPFSDSVKYLEVTLDNKLSWKTHIETKTTACKKLMIMLNSNLRGMYAPKPKLSKMGIYWGCTAKTTVYMYDLGELHKHATTIEKAKSLRQISSKINYYNNKNYTPSKCRNHDRPNAHRTND